MIHLFLGTDREKARAKMGAIVEKAAKKADVVRITDAHTIEDLKAALQGGGMFGGKRVLVFENVCTNPDLSETFVDSLEWLSRADEEIFIFESKPLADLRKKLEKYAETIEKFDVPAKERDTSVFAMASALRTKNKRALWIGYMQEVAHGAAPEAVHGVLFWAAKDMLLKAGSNAAAHARAVQLVITLVELPHEARRHGEPMEYALERFILSGA